MTAPSPKDYVNSLLAGGNTPADPAARAVLERLVEKLKAKEAEASKIQKLRKELAEAGARFNAFAATADELARLLYDLRKDPTPPAPKTALRPGGRPIKRKR